MSDEYSEALSAKQSEYNDAKLQTFRLHFLWTDSHNHAREGKLRQLNWDLDRVWMELAADASDKHLKDFDDINNRIAKCNMKPNEFYLLLMEKELFLRKLQNELGLGKKYKDPLEEYMG